MVDENTIQNTIKSYDEFADLYTKAHFQANVEKQASFFVHNFDGKKILDVGCGPGRDSKFFVDKGFEVEGIDTSVEFVRMATKNVHQGKFYQMDMRDIEFPENSFDGIWVCASFLHIPKKDAKQTILKFRDILTAGGLIYNSVKLGHEEKVVDSKHNKNFKRFFADYSLEEFKKLHEEAGFEIIYLEIDKKPNGNWIDLFAKKK